MEDRTLTMPAAPPELVKAIIAARFGVPAVTVEPFSTGLSHHVFAVETAERRAYVVRLTLPARRQELEDGVYWHPRIHACGVPLAPLYASGDHDGCPFAIYGRLPGADLEQIYTQLSPPVRQSLACAVAAIQQKIGALEDPRLHLARPWSETVAAILERSQLEIVQAGLADAHYVERARASLSRCEGYWHRLRPVAFLYDLNVRNVIVNAGQVSGIVDIDEVWYGDPLLAIGRGKALLLLMQQATDYISAWCDFLRLSAEQRRVVDSYTLLYCVRFMGTVGLRLNGNPHITTDPEQIPLLEQIADTLSAGGCAE